MVTIPRGLKIEKIDDNKIIIKTDKKELVLSDYIAIFFFCFGIIGWTFLLTETGFNNFINWFSLIILGFIILLLLVVIFSIYKTQTIIITKESIEIIKKCSIFTRKQKLDRNLIEKIDFKELLFPTFTFPSILIMIKYACNLGYFKIPRIKYKGDEINIGEDIYIFEHLKKNIREWIVDYLNEEIK